MCQHGQQGVQSLGDLYQSDIVTGATPAGSKDPQAGALMALISMVAAVRPATVLPHLNLLLQASPHISMSDP